MWLLEGILFYFSITPRWRLWPSRSYLHWRLGTVYRSFNDDGTPRSIRALLRDLWADRSQAIRFLKWRRSMRLQARKRG